MKRLSLLAFLVLINCILDSCASSSNVTCHELEFLDIKNFTLDGYTESNTNDTTSVDSYAILLNAKSISRTCMANYSFGASLMADEPVIRLLDKVSNVSIKSNADLSANFPAGSELKSLFTPIRVRMSCLDNNASTSDCETDYFANSFSNSLESAINEIFSPNLLFGFDDPDLFSLNLNEEPIQNNEHIITIQFDFENGTSTVLSTESIILN